MKKFKICRIAIIAGTILFMILTFESQAQVKLNLSFTGVSYANHNLTVTVTTESGSTEMYYREPRSSYLTLKLDTTLNYRINFNFNNREKVLFIPKGSVTRKKTRLLIDFRSPAQFAKYEKNKIKIVDEYLSTQ